MTLAGIPGSCADRVVPFIARGGIAVAVGATRREA
jgi:hypothetical protein